MFHPLIGVAGDKNLSRPGIGFEALGRVYFIADNGVVGSPFGTNISRDHNSCVDADAHVQAYLGKFYKCDARQSFLNGEGAAHSTQWIVVASDRRAKKGHESIAAKFVQGSPEFKDGIDDQLQIAIEDVDHVLGIELLSERRESAQVAEKNRNFALVTAQSQMPPGIGDDLSRDFRRDVPAEKITEQMILCLDLIVERFNPEKRFYSRQQLFAVDGLAEKIIGA